RLAENYGIQIDAICGEATDLHLPLNVRLFKVGFSKMDLLDRGLFTLRLYNLAKKLVRGANLVHHMFPFGFRIGFNSLAVFRHLREKPFIIGPIQYPQEYSDITDYEWVSGRSGLKARLMYDLECTAMRFIQKPIEMFHEATLSEAEALVFDSKKTLEKYRKLYSDILRGKTLEVIPPGVETEQFQYAPPIEKDHFEILTASYLLRRKGIQYLIKAMPLILREFRNVKLKIIGDGPYRQELMRLVNKLSLDNAVSFEGKVPRHEMSKYCSSCDVYIQPSLSETFPSSVREAMSVGRPVVVTDVGFIREHIVDGVNGFIVQKGDVDALANRIVTLLSDDDLRLKIGLEARRYAEKNFDWNEKVKKWYQIYAKLINS
ncbi:MAG: glycosyltransferase family 4 protein, partial [Nitrososphaerota archaeon]